MVKGREPAATGMARATGLQQMEAQAHQGFRDGREALAKKGDTPNNSTRPGGGLFHSLQAASPVHMDGATSGSDLSTGATGGFEPLLQ